MRSQLSAGLLIRRSQVRALVGEPLRGKSGHSHRVAEISRCRLRKRGVAAGPAQARDYGFGLNKSAGRELFGTLSHDFLWRPMNVADAMEIYGNSAVAAVLTGERPVNVRLAGV